MQRDPRKRVDMATDGLYIDTLRAIHVTRCRVSACEGRTEPAPAEPRAGASVGGFAGLTLR